jgi:mono/diheme cytochrome c family protein
VGRMRVVLVGVCLTLGVPASLPVRLSAAHLAGASVSASTTTSSSAADATERRALLGRYCITCHNERLRTAQLALDSVDLADVSANAALWEKVVRKLRSGVMPPAGSPRPDRATVEALAGALEQSLDRASLERPDPGRPASVHRLNRAEYRNAVRDLLGLDIDVATLLPPDSASYGFDNIGDVLSLSPMLLDRYLSAARKISSVAVGSRSNAPTTDTFRVPSDLTQDGTIADQPFGTRGGIVIRYNFPLDGEYDIRIRLARESVTDAISGLRGSHQIEVSLDSERIQLFTLVDGKPISSGDQDAATTAAITPAGASRSRRDAGFYGDDAARVADAGLQLRVAVKAGPRLVRVAFIQHSSVEIETVRKPFLRAAPENGDSHGQPYLNAVTISGPFNGREANDTPSRQRIFVCRPDQRADEIRCATQILTRLARQAYRRPATAGDTDDLLAFFREGQSHGGFDTGIELALVRLLVGPSFLFRTELEPANVAGSAYRISDLDLASRLSFFLWSSIPDDQLLDLAIRGTLRQPAVLEAQVRRMLKDPRAEALIQNFAGQWLFLRNVPTVLPDRRLFPDFDDNLRDGFRRETELFFGSVLREDRGALELLTADYTFVNERLARHYGIPGVYGDRFRRVTFDDGVRGGLLGQGSILTVRSYANRTSPVLRGVWILENILGSPPPPPPPNVPALKDTSADGRVLSMRERMVQHRRNPACAACHARMDPLGLPMESFDAVGRLRQRSESNAPLDVSGALPDGTTFEGVAGLRQALLSHSGEFVATLTEKLLTYALGRGVEYYDAPAIRRITRDAERDDYRLSSLILEIVRSTPFQMRRAAAGVEPQRQ